MIKKIVDYGFDINFEGIDIDYDQHDVTDNLVDVLGNTLPDITNICHHNKTKSFENFKKVSDINFFNRIFKPLFFDKL